MKKIFLFLIVGMIALFYIQNRGHALIVMQLDAMEQIQRENHVGMMPIHQAVKRTEHLLTKICIPQAVLPITLILMIQTLLIVI